MCVEIQGYNDLQKMFFNDCYFINGTGNTCAHAERKKKFRYRKKFEIFFRGRFSF